MRCDLSNDLQVRVMFVLEEARGRLKYIQVIQFYSSFGFRKTDDIRTGMMTAAEGNMLSLKA